ncbi:MAG: DsbA family protein [Myxococcota bacterium]
MSEPIRVAIDFASPAAYLALEPTRALESRLGRPFDWLPFGVPPLSAPKPSSAHDDRGARHRRIRAEYLARDLRRYAESRGLELGDLYREPDTTQASLGLLWLHRRAPARASDYAARVFERIWRENGSAGAAFVEKTLAGESAGFRAYAAGDGPAELAAVRSELEAAAVWSVPAFLVRGELFLGRQHLPMVEWLATGESGPAPI